MSMTWGRSKSTIRSLNPGLLTLGSLLVVVAYAMVFANIHIPALACCVSGMILVEEALP